MPKPAPSSAPPSAALALAALLLAACAAAGPPIEPAWLVGRWETSPVSAVTGGRWTLEVARARDGDRLDASWTAGAGAPSAAVLRIDGDRLLVLAPGGEQGRFRRTEEGTLDGIVRPAGRNAASVPVTLLRR